MPSAHLMRMCAEMYGEIDRTADAAVSTGVVRASTESSMPDDQESAQNPTEPEAASDQQPAEGAEAPPAEQSSETEQADELASSALASAQAAISALGGDDDVEAASDASAPAQPSMEEMLKAAEAEAADAPAPVSFPDFAAASVGDAPKGIDLLSDVNVDVTIELGRTHMLVEDVLRLAEGAVVELDKLAGDPVDIYVNQRLVARGEVLVLNDNFCIRVNDILDADLVEQDA